MPKSAPDFNLKKAIEELEEIEKYLQEPDLDIEKAIERHGRALALGKEVIAYLETAENRLEKMDLGGSGQNEGVDNSL